MTERNDNTTTSTTNTTTGSENLESKLLIKTAECEDLKKQVAELKRAVSALNNQIDNQIDELDDMESYTVYCEGALDAKDDVIESILDRVFGPAEFDYSEEDDDE